MKRSPRIAAFLGVMALTACGRAKPRVISPGHDAHWPIEAPQADVYSEFLKGSRRSTWGDTESAAAAFREALRLDPKSPYLHVRLAEELFRRGDLASAEDLCRGALALDAQYRDARFLLGKIHAARKEWGKSEEELIEVMTIDPSEARSAAMELSGIYVEAKMTEKAIALLKTLLEKDPEDAQVHYVLGRIYTDQNRPEEALKSYEQAVAISPTFTPALTATAMVYEFQGKADQAMAAYNRVLEVDPDNPGVRGRLARYHLERKEWDAAAAHFEAVARANPDDIVARLRVALIRLQQERSGAAQGILKELVRAAPDFDQARYYYGVALEKEKMHGEAVREFEKVKPDSDMYEEAQTAIAFVHETGRKDAAAADRSLRLALRKKPKAARLVAALAGVLLRQEKKGEAEELLKNAIEQAPRDETLWFSLGEVYDKQGKLEGLERAMRKVIEINPDNANALNYLGYTFADKGIHLDEAEQLIRRALEIKPGDGYITDSLGWVYYRKRDYDRAVEKLEEALQLVPADPTITEHLGDAVLKKGDRERALDLYRKALDLAKDEEDRKRIREKLAPSPAK